MGIRDRALLAYLMEDPFLQKAPPKTSGREVYGAAYVDRLQARAGALGVSPLDTLATATRFTACLLYTSRCV